MSGESGLTRSMQYVDHMPSPADFLSIKTKNINKNNCIGCMDSVDWNGGMEWWNMEWTGMEWNGMERSEIGV